MNRPVILTAALAAAFIGFTIPASAGDNNDPQMKMFTWDGRIFDKDGTHPRYNQRREGKKAREATGRDGPRMKGMEKSPTSKRKPR